MNDTELRLTDPDQLLAEEEHWVCCHDESRTFCGLRTPEPCDGIADDVSCPACRATSVIDELMGGRYCPMGGVCTHALNLCACPPDPE